MKTWFYILIAFSTIACGNENPLPYYEDGKWGVVSMRGKNLANPTFKNLETFHNDLALAQDTKTELWGYVNSSGTFVIKPEYDDGLAFNEGYTMVQKGTSFKCLDTSGEVKFSIQDYEECSGVKNGFVLAKKDDKIYMFKVSGEKDKNFEATDALALSNTIIAYKKDNKWGMLNYSCEIIQNPQFYDVKPSSGSFYPVRNSSEWGIVDEKGIYVFTHKFVEIGEFQESKAAAKDKNSYKWGYIDGSGKWIIEASYNGAKPFSDGLAAVKLKDYWGFIDYTGKLVIEASFNEVSNFQNGVAWVKEKTSWGLIGKDGKFIINPTYSKIASPFDYSRKLINRTSKFGSQKNDYESTSSSSASINSNASFFDTSIPVDESYIAKKWRVVDIIHTSPGVHNSEKYKSYLRKAYFDFKSSGTLYCNLKSEYLRGFWHVSNGNLEIDLKNFERSKIKVLKADAYNFNFLVYWPNSDYFVEYNLELESTSSNYSNDSRKRYNYTNENTNSYYDYD